MKSLLGLVIGIAAVYLALSAATGKALPFGLNSTSAVWAVLGLGMTACALGGVGDVLQRVGGNWGSPWVLAGVVLGVIAFVAVAGALRGFALGPIAGASAWMAVLAVVIGVKMAVALVQVLTFAAVARA